jgi:2-iminobutanoate/2-iminopropanoate deaminase
MKFIHTDQAPIAIGAYSQAILHQGMLYTSGQIALSPETGQLVSRDIQEQTKQCLKNLKCILNASGADINTILKVVIYLKNMDNFIAVNEIYQAWIGNHRPARTTIAVSGLPRDALIEIECIASVVISV